MNLYLDNGYADMKKIMALPYPFIFVVGGRGTGKTYGACEELLDLPESEKFLFMRRTGDEAELIASTDFSPFNPVINDNPDKYEPMYTGAIQHVKGITAAWKGEPDDKGVIKPVGAPRGYFGALTTIYKTRGFSMEDVTVVLYDEFIPEKHVHAIRNEGECFLNAVETISRNRELRGRKPLKVICLSNANKLASPIFVSLGIMENVEKMVMRNQSQCFLPERGIAVIRLQDSKISQAKANTALYKAANSPDFVNMALKNDFDSSTNLYIKREPIDEFKLLASVDDDVYIYRHKSEARYYVSRHKRGTAKHKYLLDDISVRRLKREQYMFFDAWLRGRVSFEDYYTKYILTNCL